RPTGSLFLPYTPPFRSQNRFDEAERVFRFGSHVEGRDATAIKKTVSGLLKIIHPDGGWTKEELTEYVELAMEGRRRVKEQLKKRDRKSTRLNSSHVKIS